MDVGALRHMFPECSTAGDAVMMMAVMLLMMTMVGGVLGSVGGTRVVDQLPDLSSTFCSGFNSVQETKFFL